MEGSLQSSWIKKKIKNLANTSFLISEKIHETTLSLHISFGTTKNEVLKVCEIINNF